ncbi:MAG: REP-associated tyrosine transposase [Phycisphaerales bacterium]
MKRRGSDEVQVFRKRLRRREIHLGIRYLTCSCYKRLPLLGNPSIRDEFVDVLIAARRRHGFRLIAWVVMPEHFHLLIVPTAGLGTGSDVPAILIGIKKTLAARVLRRWCEASWSGLAGITAADGTARFWQAGGGFDRNVRDEFELERTIEYIHHNPVERGLVRSSLDWRWSSARWYAGVRENTPEIDSIEGRE